MKNTYDFGLENENVLSNQVKSNLDFNENNKLNSIRDAYSFYLSKILIKNKNLVLVDADLGTVAKTNEIAKKINKRYVQAGIAEQNAIGLAAGIAQFGKIPIVQSLAVFLTGRAFDQLRESVAYSNLNVKLVGLHAGFTLSPDGATHQTGEDIALISSLPNFEIYAPADYKQLKVMLPIFLKSKKPGYLRLFFPKCAVISNKKIQKNKIQIVKKVQKINLVSYGYMSQTVNSIFYKLEKKGIKVGVLNVPFIKPLDNNQLISISKKTDLFFIIEDHNQYGGLGSIISQTLSEKIPTKIVSINSKDKFGTTGLPDENLDYLGLSQKKIIKKILYYAKKK